MKKWKKYNSSGIYKTRYLFPKFVSLLHGSSSTRSNQEKKTIPTESCFEVLRYIHMKAT